MLCCFLACITLDGTTPTGSAVFKSIFPAMLSGALILILYFTTDIFRNRGAVLIHPYPMTALIAALTFLLSFRANFAYNR